MSVINQMLKDLEGRQSRSMPAQGVFRAASTKDMEVNLGRHYKAAIKPLFVVAVILCIGSFFWQQQRAEAVINTESAQTNSSAAPETPATVAQAEPAIVSPQKDIADSEMASIDSVSLESGKHGMRLVFESGQPLETSVQQVFAQDGSVVYTFRDVRLNSATPILAHDNPYISTYSITHEHGNTIVRLLPRESVLVAARSDKDSQSGRHRFAVNISLNKVLVESQPKKQVVQKSIAKKVPAKSTIVKADSGSEEAAKQITIKRHVPVENADEHYRKALQALQANQLDDSMRSLRQALRINPQLHPARELLSTLLLRTGHMAEAYQMLKEGMRIEPAFINYARLYGQSLVAAGKPDEAIGILAYSEAYAGQDGDYQALMAALEQRLSRHQSAVAHYMIALKLKPKQGAWWMGMAISLEAVGRKQEARKAYITAMESRALNKELIDYAQNRIKSLGG